MIIAGIILSIVIFIVLAFGLVFWRANLHMAKIERFTERAIAKYLKTEAPVALRYIVIACSVAAGTETKRIWDPLHRAEAAVNNMPTGFEKDTECRRLKTIRDSVMSTEFGVKKSHDLKRDLTDEEFLAWRKLDASIFDRI